MVHTSTVNPDSYASAPEKGSESLLARKIIDGLLPFPKLPEEMKEILDTALEGNAAIVPRLTSQAVANDNDEALRLGATGGHLELVQYVAEECGVDVNTARNDGDTALMMAASNGMMRVIRYLIYQCHEDVNATNYNGDTALMRAASNGKIEVVRSFIEECGVAVNTTNKDGETALMKAATYGRFEIVKYLAVKCGLKTSVTSKDGVTASKVSFSHGKDKVVQYFTGEERGAFVNTRDHNGETAVMKAAAHGAIEIVRYLAEECGAVLDTMNADGATALMKAAENGAVEVVQYLSKHHVVNALYLLSRGRALVLAAANGRIDVVRHLVEKCGEDLNFANFNEFTALMKAAENGEMEIVQYIAGYCRALRSRGRALVLAAENGEIEIVRYLVENCGANVNVASFNGFTPLMKAAEKGKFEVVQYLTRRCGVDKYSLRSRGVALVLTAENGNLEITRYLAEKCGVDMSFAIKYGAQAIIAAARKGKLAVVQYLTENCGVSINSLCWQDKALMLAIENGKIEIVQYLFKQCGADVNSSFDGFTALMKAAEKGKIEIVQYLVERCGVDINARSLRGTALLLAAENGEIEAVRFLAEQGADVMVDGYMAVMVAANKGHVTVVQYLSQLCGVDIDSIRSKPRASWLTGKIMAAWNFNGKCATSVDAIGPTSLIEAAGKGRVEIVQYLVEQCGVDINAVCLRALAVAAERGMVDVVQYIVDRCSATCKVDGSAAFLRAAGKGKIKVVKYLAEHSGVVLDSIHSKERSLALAAAHGEIEIFQYLVEKCSVDVNVPSLNGCTVLMIAAEKGRIEIVQYLVERCRVNINGRSSRGTALLLAAENGEIETVRYLAEKSCLGVKADGPTAFLKAAGKGKVEVVQYLADHCDLTINRRVLVGALLRASEKGNLEVVRCLAEKYDADASNIGAVALMKAAENGRISIVQYLAEQRSADVNARCKLGVTVLMMAAQNGEIKVVQYLAEQCGANVDSRCRLGVTALMKAAEKGIIAIVQYLVQQHGANVNARSKLGYTALLLASTSGKIDVVRYLAEKCCADVNIATNDGYTALIKATENNDAATVQYLLQRYGTDVHTKTRTGDTAVRVAAARGFHNIQRILIPFIQPVLQSYTSISPDTTVYLISPSEIELTIFSKDGSIGGDFYAKWLDADVTVKLFIEDASYSTFESEARLWQQLRHPNVIKMYGACVAGPNLQLFVCEYTRQSSLNELTNPTQITKLTMWKWLHEAALGLEYLHERGIIHGNLRCSNILVGSDGVAKLSNFSLSGSTIGTLPHAIGETRWQAPEILKGESSSHESDVYSLGMCILESETGERPWGKEDEIFVKRRKMRWMPEATVKGGGEPHCPQGVARDLVWRMCCQDPRKRPSLSYIRYKLEMLSMKASTHNEQEPICAFSAYDDDMMKGLWLKVVSNVEKRDNTHHKIYDKLKIIRGLLQKSMHHPTLFRRFHTLLIDYYRMVKISPEQTRMMRLSSTSVTNNSLYALQWRVNSLVASLGEAEEAQMTREVQWQEQRCEQTDNFVSGISDTLLLLKNLKSSEERSLFLRNLMRELEDAQGKYTAEQREVMMEACNVIASKLRSEGGSNLIPNWFIPWYELIVSEWDKLGEGGFGSVYKAKWLESEVVVKRVSLDDSNINSGSSPLEYSLSASLDYLTPEKSFNVSKRIEALKIFRHEVDIWFGLSHPHVIQLFGACHVGRPFFVCELATNGTLVSYLRENCDQLWPTLYEAALGVQYLHARGVVHGDLKGNNIVIGSDKKAKVTDFGLSAVENSGAQPVVSAAWNWVAPECLSEVKPRPTYASDVYSLGMCIVEALRVVEAAKFGKSTACCLPWTNPNRDAIKYHARRGELPSRPIICDDNHWDLIKRMCALNPGERIHISTVVDELATLANTNLNTQKKNSKEIFPNKDTDTRPVAGVISEARELLIRLHRNIDRRNDVLDLYMALWNRMEEVKKEVDRSSASKCVIEFCRLIADANLATLKLQDRNRSLVTYAEKTMRCYTLSRRLDKLCEAFSIVRHVVNKMNSSKIFNSSSDPLQVSTQTPDGETESGWTADVGHEPICTTISHNL
ncbi:serine/threonine protein kinase [Phytophthora nicotianae P10297]|uniref:Serine/threonine protein kinase n=1 Tax=Phytophthora nicotianae P10297 TaxID=1317064 RepID=W2Y0S6_PHYNI|nr:serine/threonine protein kinase [Phytophthora nicotianae P10297]